MNRAKSRGAPVSPQGAPSSAPTAFLDRGPKGTPEELLYAGEEEKALDTSKGNPSAKHLKDVVAL